LTVQTDGSVLASGPNPDLDTYTIVLTPQQPLVTGFRLELLPDPSLPNGNTGRALGNGNCALSEFEVSVVRNGVEETTPVAWQRAVSDHRVAADKHYAKMEIHAGNAVDGNLKTYWEPWPKGRTAVSAIFVPVDRIETPPGTKLMVRLISNTPTAFKHNLGRFRLSVTGAIVDRELRRPAVLRLENPWQRLAAAFDLFGLRDSYEKLRLQRPDSVLGLADVTYHELQDPERAMALYRDLMGADTPPGPLVFPADRHAIMAPHIPFDSYSAFALEAWVWGWSGRVFEEGATGDPENGIYLCYGPDASYVNSGWEAGEGTNHWFLPAHSANAGWRHLAMTFDGRQQRFFIDGRLLENHAAPPPGPLVTSRPLVIGAGKGLLGLLRVSRVARYTEEFTPSKTLTTDDDTVLFYDMTSIGDGILQDQSRDRRHGRIFSIISGASRGRP
jgi:hypothetical protein